MADSIRDELRNLLPVNRALVICAAMSSCLLASAFLFEYLGGFAPCKMCIWQRWAHAALILTALFGLMIPMDLRLKLALLFVVFVALISTAIAGFHAGVEWQLWDGPSGCTASLNNSDELTFLVDQLLATPVVRCDEVPWSLFGISMAGWNSLLSLDIAAFALISWLANRRVG